MIEPLKEGVIKIVAGEASIELRPDGDILVNGRIADNDKAVVSGMRSLLGLREPPRFDVDRIVK